LQDQGLKINMH